MLITILICFRILSESLLKTNNLLLERGTEDQVQWYDLGHWEQFARVMPILHYKKHTQTAQVQAKQDWKKYRCMRCLVRAKLRDGRGKMHCCCTSSAGPAQVYQDSDPIIHKKR